MGTRPRSGPRDGRSKGRGNPPLSFSGETLIQYDLKDATSLKECDVLLCAYLNSPCEVPTFTGGKETQWQRWLRFQRLVQTPMRTYKGDRSRLEDAICEHVDGMAFVDDIGPDLRDFKQQALAIAGQDSAGMKPTEARKEAQRKARIFIRRVDQIESLANTIKHRAQALASINANARGNG